MLIVDKEFREFKEFKTLLDTLELHTNSLILEPTNYCLELLELLVSLSPKKGFIGFSFPFCKGRLASIVIKQRNGYARINRALDNSYRQMLIEHYRTEKGFDGFG